MGHCMSMSRSLYRTTSVKLLLFFYVETSANMFVSTDVEQEDKECFIYQR